MTKDLVAIVGFKSSGKNTAAEALIPYGYKPLSFAESLKDALASIFCWDRELLEGITDESRQWRETVDEWWAERLDIPDFTPRWMMMNFGTDIMRKTFHDDIWLLNIERKIMIHDKVVITDTRFPNEIKMAKRYNGKVIRVKRGPDPEWMNIAKNANAEINDPEDNGSPASTLTISYRKECREAMKKLNIHPSECKWIGCPVDIIIENDTTIENLKQKVLDFVL